MLLGELGGEIGRVISLQGFQNGVNGVIAGLGLEALYGVAGEVVFGIVGAGVAYRLVTEGAELINNLSLVNQIQGQSSNSEGNTRTVNIEDELGEIALGYGDFKCVEAAEAMANYLKNRKQKYKIISMKYPTFPGIMYCILKNDKVVSKNGYHMGVLYNDVVYCNIHPYGLPVAEWLNDFIASGFGVVTPPEYQSLKWRHFG